MAAELDALFAPGAVAVYGASATDPSRLGNVLLRNALGSGVSVCCVHPRAEQVEGVPATVRLEGPVDLALVSVPAERAEGAVLDAVGAGAKVVIVLSSGFAEAGEHGRELQDRIARICREHGTRLVGPNCMGVLSATGRHPWLNGSYYWELDRRAGPVAFVSQSGAFGGMFLAAMSERGLGLSRFVSLGNTADVGIADVLEWLGEDPATEVIGVFCEAITDGRRFIEVARRITPRKPVVVLKGGRGEPGRRAAVGHTASMTGDERTYSAAFRRAGVVETSSSTELFDALAAMTVPALRRHGRRTAILTVSGGPAVLAADAMERCGLALSELPPARKALIAAHAPEAASVGNPVDLTAQCRPEDYGPAVAALYAEDSIDAVVVINCGLDLPEFGTAVASAYAATGKPTTAFLLDTPRARAAVCATGIPCFDSPEAAVHAIAAGSIPGADR